MTEREILEALKLVEEAPLEVNLELPLPAPAADKDYFSILQDLRSTLADDAKTSAAQPEEDLLEIEAPTELSLSQKFSPAPENDFDFPEPAASLAFNFAETAELPSPEMEFPEEIPFEDEIVPSSLFAAPENVETVETEFAEKPFGENKQFEDSDKQFAFGEDFAAKEDFQAPVFASLNGENESENAVETQFAEPEFKAAPQFDETVEDESSAEAVFARENSFVAESKQFAAFETHNFDFVPEEISGAHTVGDFQFVETVANFSEPAEIAEETGKFDFARTESETENRQDSTDDLETESFASAEPFVETLAESNDFTEFLPEAPLAFLKDFEEPEAPQVVEPENDFEILPQPEVATAIDENEQSRSQFVVFKVDGDSFAFPSSSVVEIGYQPELSSLPFVPSWFSGITNLRGDIIAVLDLRGLWEKSPANFDARQKMVIVRSENENLTVGLLVDSVSEMRSLGESEINSFDEFPDEPFVGALSGICRTQDSVLHLLDVERLLASPKLRNF